MSLSDNDKCKEIKMPIGYRFDPTDVELLEHYLIPKLKGEELPSEYVMDLDDIYQYEPHQLPFEKFKHAKEKEAYFFTEDTNSELEHVRSTPNGFWKICHENTPIYGTIDMIIIGFKTKLFFYNSDCNKTDWIMIQYRCTQHPHQTLVFNIKSFIICKVEQKMNMEEDQLSQQLELSERENGKTI